MDSVLEEVKIVYILVVVSSNNIIGRKAIAIRCMYLRSL